MTDSVILWVSERLVTASLQGAGVIALVWLVCRSLPNIPASVHAALWWLAALKLVLVMLPVPALAIPVLPATLEWRRESPSPSPAMARGARAVSRNTPAAPAAHAATGSPAGATDSGGSRWLEAVILLWFGVVVLQAARLLTAFRTLRGVVRRLSRWTDDDADAVARLATLVGLTRAPQVRTSDEILAPQVAGLWRPVVLMPADTTTALTADERAMTLCHELMHIRRHDLALGWVPALAERLFFFHPLARLAAREYVTSRESACDAAVVRALGVSPTDYGRMLVRLGVAGSEPAFTAGSAPSSMSSLRRRLEMLQHASSPDASRRSTWLIAAMACALVPLQLVAGTPGARQQLPAARPAVAVARAAAPAVPNAPAETAAPRVAAPVEPPPAETAPSEPALAAEALPQDERAAGAQDAERASLTTLTRRYADALRQMSAEYAFKQQLEQGAAEQQSRESKMRAAITEALERMAAQTDRIRVEQDSRESRERLLEQIARQQQAGQPLNEQLEQLTRQMEILTRHITQIAEQQEQLAAAQRLLAEQAEQIRRLSEDTERIRRALEAR